MPAFFGVDINVGSKILHKKHFFIIFCVRKFAYIENGIIFAM